MRNGGIEPHTFLPNFKDQLRTLIWGHPANLAESEGFEPSSLFRNYGLAICWINRSPNSLQYMGRRCIIHHQSTSSRFPPTHIYILTRYIILSTKNFKFFYFLLQRAAHFLVILPDLTADIRSFLV